MDAANSGFFYVDKNGRGYFSQNKNEDMSGPDIPLEKKETSKAAQSTGKSKKAKSTAANDGGKSKPAETKAPAESPSSQDVGH